MAGDEGQDPDSDTGRATSDELASEDHPVKEKTTAAYCYYNGQQYSPGAIICMFGKQYVCGFDGAWNPNGESC
jgi:hypothetical protein